VFHWRYTSAGGVTEDIIRPVVSVSLEIYLCWWSQRGYHPPSSQCFTGDILLLAESPRISSATGGIIEDPPSRQYFTGDIPLLVESPRLPSAQWSVFHWRYTSAGGVTEDIIRPVVSVSLVIYLCWWSHRGYHPPRS
jgi:hypothetical protein